MEINNHAAQGVILLRVRHYHILKHIQFSHAHKLDHITICASSQEGQLRLTSPNEMEGRVEVCMNGRWERVCSSGQGSTISIVKQFC